MSTPEFEKLLDELVDASKALEYDTPDEEWKRFLAARTAITGYVSGLKEERDATRIRCDEGYRAHGASFKALQEISFLTGLNGEVSEYSDVVAAVARLREATLTEERAQQILWAEELRDELRRLSGHPSTKPGESQVEALRAERK